VTATESHRRKTRFAEFRFYEELNDFLPANRRKTSFRWLFFIVNLSPKDKSVTQNNN